ncbi:MAG: hypothetical protein HY717_20815 [Planctomycetes bacterium]|nr:hypothetical protein [Planctomycetota bacterium]
MYLVVVSLFAIGGIGLTIQEVPSAAYAPSSSYQAVVPNTLDLAERAKIGIHHAMSIIREDQDYEMPWTGGGFQWSPLMACQPKYMEYLPMERIMSGSQQKLDLEAKMVNMLASHIGPEGIYWVPGYENKPWLGPKDEMPYANVHGQGRMMRAMAIWYQYTKDPKWKELVDRMVDGMDKVMVVHKDDYAYFPIYGWMPNEYFRSCYTRRGWKDTVEPTHEKFGEEGSMFNHQGHLAGVLANWYMLTGNKQALRLSGELVRFLVKPKFWADFQGGEYPGVVGAEQAHWTGHWHGHINALRAILEYAVATNDPRLKQFVRDGYGWARQPMFARIGMVGDGQGCGCGRLIGLAVKLAYAGIGDYWEDIDLYIRNHGSEMQFTPEDCGNKMIPAVGGFAANPAKDDWAGCCTPHGNMGLFYAWDATLRYSDGVARINLLLNRASPWMDLDSYLPYEGKVIIKNKTALEAFVRIPLWVELNTVHCKVGLQSMPLKWFGRYLVVKTLKPSDLVTITFPVVERSEKWTLPAQLWGWWPGYPPGTVFTFKFKGNTLIDMSPWPTQGSQTPDESRWRPYSERAKQYASDEAPMVNVTRFVSPLVFSW